MLEEGGGLLYMGHPGKSEERTGTSLVAGNLGRELHQGGKVLQPRTYLERKGEEVKDEIGRFLAPRYSSYGKPW